MGFFGKSEAELKQIASDLEKRQTDLDNRESNIESKKNNLAHELNLLSTNKALFDTKRSDHATEVKRIADNIAVANAELEKRRSEIAMLEAKASSNFADAQRDVFKEVVEKRHAELDSLKKDLDVLAADVAKRLESLHSREGDLSRRELAVTEREQKADSGFADITKTLADEAARQHQANQIEAEHLRKRADSIAQESQNIEVAKAKLVQREQAIIAAEQKRDVGFADERAALDTELRNKRTTMESEFVAVRGSNLSRLEDEIARLRTTRLVEIANAEQIERDRIRADIANERDVWTKLQEESRKKLDVERTEIEKQKGAVFALQTELDGLKIQLESGERTNERKEQRLEQQWQKRNAHLDDTIEARVEDRRNSFEDLEKTSKSEIERLRGALRIQTELVGTFDQLKRQLGDRDPAEIILEINSKTILLKDLHEKLSTLPTEEMRERYREMESESQRMKAKIEELEKQITANATTVAESNSLRRKSSELDAENKSLAQKASIFEGAANEAQAELKRLHAAYESPSEVAARYKEIEMPHIKADKVTQPKKVEIDEMTWLTGIGNACENFGLHFNPRILKAFHTALKTAEWSLLTVLTGVSGTGKSELPRLYSYFGGLLFEPLSVQPNWDSQESMLGFFNSIDNKFDSQPVLRFLAQSQVPVKESYEQRIARWRTMAGTDLKLNSENDKDLIQSLQESDYQGLEDCMCLILLDEMNLAHPELYFAEFLSKLELRRGKTGVDVPCLPVKIGAGKPEYKLPLGRNVLWTGTMNQDETTKSLSDKVLDRSIIIHFPRPDNLKSRPRLPSLDKIPFTPLHRKTWESWWIKEVKFEADEIAPFRQFLEEINSALANSGRAVGHRVWQSVEYYMGNHPDVRAAQKTNDNEALAKALHVAFEDQLVQKVMPKLRGIDTRERSEGKKCLDKILALINAGVKGGKPFNLAKDFNLACELGYGQFIWQSANYIKEDTNSGKNEVVNP